MTEDKQPVATDGPARPDALLAGTRIHREALGRAAFAVLASCRSTAASFEALAVALRGPKADDRKRPRRVHRKIEARGGFRRFRGAL